MVPAQVGIGAGRGELCRPDQSWKEFAGRHGDPGLALALYVGRRCTGMTLRALGQAAGGMDYTAVSMAIKRFEQRLPAERKLRHLAQRLLESTERNQAGAKCEM